MIKSPPRNKNRLEAQAEYNENAISDSKGFPGESQISWIFRPYTRNWHHSEKLSSCGEKSNRFEKCPITQEILPSPFSQFRVLGGRGKKERLLENHLVVNHNNN